MENKMKIISDSGPEMITFDVTGICNFRCLHCYNDSGKPIECELSDEETIDIAKQIVAMNPLSVCICGGEPTTRKNLLEIISIISFSGIAVSMVSNGSLLNEEKLIALKNAGLDTLQISLDGRNSFVHDTFRGYPGSFEKAVENIKIAKKLGLSIVTSTTPSKLNINSIPKHFEFCFRIGLDSVRMMPLIPMGRGSRIDRLLPSPDEYFKLQMIIRYYKDYYADKGMNIEWGDPLDHYTRMPNNAKVGMKTYTMEIKANGNLTVSTYIPVIVGNIRKHSLREYWENGYADIWKNKKVLDYVERINTIYDINQMNPKPYSGEYYYVELMEE